MKCSIAFLLVAACFSGCAPGHLTPEDIAREKRAIESVAVQYNRLVAEKSTEAILNLFSDSPELIFIGTDSAEVFKNKSQLKSHLEVDWQLLEISKVGELRNVSILLSSDAGLASMLYEVPWDMNFAGQVMHVVVRFAMTMTKEGSEWHIIQGLGQIATVGQSSEDMLAQMKRVKK